MSRLNAGTRWLIVAVFSGTALVLVGCGADRVKGTPQSNPPPAQSMPQRDINAVLSDHDQELMAIPGVAGVYVGVLEDGRTPCLKVMAVRKTPELERRIPRMLEGYTVIVEESGEIRPLPQRKNP